jgi:hypothetical protein
MRFDKSQLGSGVTFAWVLQCCCCVITMLISRKSACRFIAEAMILHQVKAFSIIHHPRRNMKHVVGQRLSTGCCSSPSPPPHYSIQRQLSHGRTMWPQQPYFASVRKSVQVLSTRSENNDPFNSHNDRNNDDDDNVPKWDTSALNHRLYQLRVKNLEEEYRRSPPYINDDDDTDRTPIQFIETCLRCLRCNCDPYPDSGIRLLLRVSSQCWRDQIYQSVGIQLPRHPRLHNDDDDDTRMVSAISEAISQPKNQFAILVGAGENYVSIFPSEPLVFETKTTKLEEQHNHVPEHHHHHHDDDHHHHQSVREGQRTCWVECQLRHAETDQLLVMMGWQLRYDDVFDQWNNTDSTCWTTHPPPSGKTWWIDHIDWQDFRDGFRPGVGREEWVRICG